MSTQKVKAFLDKLATCSGNDSTQADFDCRVLGKDASSLHVAIETGVVKIPVDAITDITPLGDGIDYAHVVVADASAVEYVRKVQPVADAAEGWAIAPGSAGILDDVLSGTDSYTRQCVDTATITGGRPDATDDARCRRVRDDIEV